MINIIDTLNTLNKFYINRTIVDESWGYLYIEGNYYENIKSDLKELQSLNDYIQFQRDVTIYIDRQEVNQDEFLDYINLDFSITNWRIEISKINFLQNQENHSYFQIFISQQHFLEWLKKLSPFDYENPINLYSPLKIVVNEFDSLFGGPLLLILGVKKLSQANFFSSSIRLPNEDEIKENVHLLSKDTIALNPQKFFICGGDTNNEYAEVLLKQSAQTLSICLVKEYHSNDKVILNGIKRTCLQLISTTETKITINFLEDLAKLVSWAYEDRVETRLKLFADRLTLDINSEKSLLAGLLEYLNHAFEQAKERYNFVILDRKDQYIKELKDLLKDVKNQSELYSQKLRNLLNNLLRDVIAAILLVGFTLFTKITDNIQLEKSNLIKYVFTGLAIYYITSILLQSIIDWTDIRVSKKEMYYWKNTTKEFIPTKEFENHIDSSLKSRRLSIKILYPIIALLYFLIAFACFKFPDYWSNVIKYSQDNQPTKEKSIETKKDSTSKSPKNN